MVRAIGKKLLDARMDQMAKTVAVSRVVQRKFGSEASWLALRDQLEAWKVRGSSPGAPVVPDPQGSGMATDMHTDHDMFKSAP